MKFVIIFFVVAGLMFLLLFFYPAHIFEAELAGNGTKFTTELSLKAIFVKSNFPDNVNAANVETIRPTFKGYALMFICLVGLPGLVTYRVRLHNKRNAEGSNEA